MESSSAKDLKWESQVSPHWRRAAALPIIILSAFGSTLITKSTAVSLSHLSSSGTQFAVSSFAIGQSAGTSCFVRRRMVFVIFFFKYIGGCQKGVNAGGLL